MRSRRGWIVPGLLGAGLAVSAVPAQAQSNIDAGKSPAQIFPTPATPATAVRASSSRPTKGFSASIIPPARAKPRRWRPTWRRSATRRRCGSGGHRDGGGPGACARRPGKRPPAPARRQPQTTASGLRSRSRRTSRPSLGTPRRPCRRPRAVAQPGDQAKSPQGQSRAAVMRARRPRTASRLRRRSRRSPPERRRQPPKHPPLPRLFSSRSRNGAGCPLGVVRLGRLYPFDGTGSAIGSGRRQHPGVTSPRRDQLDPERRAAGETRGHRDRRMAGKIEQRR